MVSIDDGGPEPVLPLSGARTKFSSTGDLGSAWPVLPVRCRARDQKIHGASGRAQSRHNPDPTRRRQPSRSTPAPHHNLPPIDPESDPTSRPPTTPPNTQITAHHGGRAHEIPAAVARLGTPQGPPPQPGHLAHQGRGHPHHLAQGQGGPAPGREAHHTRQEERRGSAEESTGDSLRPFPLSRRSLSHPTNN